jgi:hypothetical protein
LVGSGLRQLRCTFAPARLYAEGPEHEEPTMAYRDTDYLAVLIEHGAMHERALAAHMGVSTRDVRQQLVPHLHTGAITEQRMPDGSMVLAVTAGGQRLLDVHDAMNDVLEALEADGPRSPLDLAEDFGLDPDLHDGLMRSATQSLWITGYQPDDPSSPVSIAERGRRKLDAARARGAR